MTSALDIHLELLHTSVISTVLLSALVFLFYKHKEYQKNLKFYHSVLCVGSVLAIVAYQLMTYSTKYEEKKANYVNYEHINNVHKVKTFEANLISTEILRETWLGHISNRGEDYLWTILKLNTSKGEFHINTQAGRIYSLASDMPLCFKGNFIELITPYEGYDIKMRYYHSYSAYHRTDKSKTVCLVDFKVKVKDKA